MGSASFLFIKTQKVLIYAISIAKNLFAAKAPFFFRNSSIVKKGNTVLY